jgi:predicted amidohydrolase
LPSRNDIFWSVWLFNQSAQVTDHVHIQNQGYVFPNAQSIAPHLEYPKSGPTSLFCRELAQRLQCYVTAGYPERLELHEIEKGVDNEGNEVEKIGANSAVVYGPSGEWVGGYRKTNLYETDMTWAKAGTTSYRLSNHISHSPVS